MTRPTCFWLRIPLGLAPLLAAVAKTGAIARIGKKR